MYKLNKSKLSANLATLKKILGEVNEPEAALEPQVADLLYTDPILQTDVKTKTLFSKWRLF